MAWGHLNASALYELLPLHYYYRRVDSGASEILRYEQANLMAHITMELEATSNGSTIFVGHDTNLDAVKVLLGMTWNAGPYGVDATPPGSFVRFNMLGIMQGPSPVYGNVTIDFCYTLFDTTNGNLTCVPATFGPAGPSVIPYAKLRGLISGHDHIPTNRERERERERERDENTGRAWKHPSHCSIPPPPLLPSASSSYFFVLFFFRLSFFLFLIFAFHRRHRSHVCPELCSNLE